MSTRYNTGNPIESTDVRDMSDNAKNFDLFSLSEDETYTDRLGIDRQTIEGSIRKAGFQPASFDFVTGGTLVPGDRNKAVFNPAPSGDNNWYAWQGEFPKIISPNATPTTNGGLGENAWKPVTNNILAPTVRESIRRSYAESGYNLVDGSFEAGGALENANDVLLYEASGKAYSWGGKLSKAVTDGSTPDTTGGIGTTTWNDKSWVVFSPGRKIGNLLAWENYGGYPTIITDNRILVMKSNVSPNDAFTFRITRNVPAGNGAGTNGYVNATLSVDVTINEPRDSYEWAGLFKITANEPPITAGAGQHCALYAQAIKNKDARVWGICIETKDYVTDPTRGCVGIEQTVKVTGTDANSNRIAHHISVTSSDGSDGDHTLTHGWYLGPSHMESAKSIVGTGLSLNGRVGIGIDMSGMSINYSDKAIRMRTRQKIQWVDTNNNNAVIAQVGATLESGLLLSGVRRHLTAVGSANGYIIINIDGVDRYIPVFNAFGS